MKTSKQIAQHYNWGSLCDGWRLVDRPDISIIHERMPANTTEVRHFHEKSSQFFFVLSGQAAIEIEGNIIELNTQEGVEVAPNSKHRIYNQSPKDVEFLVISHPTTQGDRVNIDH